MASKGRSSDIDHEIKYSPSVKDRPFIVIFLINVAAFIVICVYLAVKTFPAYFKKLNEYEYRWKPNIIVAVAAVAVVTSLLYTSAVFVLLWKAPKVAIYLSFLLNIAAWIAILITLVIKKVSIVYYVVIAMIILLLCISMIINRKFYRYTAFLIRKATTVIYLNKGLVGFSILNNLLIVSINVATGLVIAAAFEEKDSIRKLLYLIIPLIFCSLWITWTLDYFQHTVIAAVTANYFYLSEDVRHTTLVSVIWKVAHYSLGSVAAASLILLLIRLLFEFIRYLSSTNEYLHIFVSCILNFLEVLIQMFGDFVFVKIGSNGASLMKAGAQTRKMFKKSLSPILNYFITKFVILSLSSFWTTACCIILYYAVDLKLNPFYIINYVVLIVITLVFTMEFLMMIHSVAITLNSCYIDDPERIKRRRSELYDEMESETLIIVEESQ